MKARTNLALAALGAALCVLSLQSCTGGFEDPGLADGMRNGVNKDKGDGSAGTLVITNLPSGMYAGNVYPNTYEDFSRVTNTTIPVAGFSAPMGENKFPLIRMGSATFERWTGTGTYFVLIGGITETGTETLRYKAQVDFVNGYASIDYNSMTDRYVEVLQQYQLP